MAWEEILKVAGTNGAFAVLFVWVLKRTFEKNDKREEKYHEMIHNTGDIIKESQKLMSKLSDKYDNLDETVEEGFKEVRKDVKNVFEMCAKRNGGCNGDN